MSPIRSEVWQGEDRYVPSDAEGDGDSHNSNNNDVSTHTRSVREPTASKPKRHRRSGDKYVTKNSKREHAQRWQQYFERGTLNQDSRGRQDSTSMGPRKVRDRSPRRSLSPEANDRGCRSRSPRRACRPESSAFSGYGGGAGGGLPAGSTQVLAGPDLDFFLRNHTVCAVRETDRQLIPMLIPADMSYERFQTLVHDTLRLHPEQIVHVKFELVVGADKLVVDVVSEESWKSCKRRVMGKDSILEVHGEFRVYFFALLCPCGGYGYIDLVSLCGDSDGITSIMIAYNNPKRVLCVSYSWPPSSQSCSPGCAIGKAHQG